MFCQRIHPEIRDKIHYLVEQGIDSVVDVKHIIRDFVKSKFDKANVKPSLIDEGYYPSNEHIRSNINRSKVALQYSKIDQENLHYKVLEWKRNTDDLFEYRPNTESDDKNSSLLYCHQTMWQQKLLKKYGQIIFLDAMYKTTKYSVPLFFICVKTNVGYTVVGEFIILDETISHVSEALSVFLKWNPHLNPKVFMVDFSTAEIEAVTHVFPNSKIFLCNFHCEQAWERWVFKKENGLSADEQKETLGSVHK